MSYPDFNQQIIILNVCHPGDPDLHLTGHVNDYPITILNTHSGEEAIGICFMNQSPALVILRPELSGLNGFETAARIRQARPEIIIIMIAENLNMSAIRLATLVGCNEIISQPISNYEIMALCNSYVRRCTV